MIKTEKLKVADGVIGSIDPSAIAEFESTDKGILVPRMTTKEINDIPNPALSLLVFNIEKLRFYFWNGYAYVSFGKTRSEYRHEFVEPYDYIAKAPKGTLETDNLWFITRITIASDGSTLSEIAVNVDWTNRYTHIYT